MQAANKAVIYQTVSLTSAQTTVELSHGPAYKDTPDTQDRAERWQTGRGTSK